MLIGGYTERAKCEGRGEGEGREEGEEEQTQQVPPFQSCGSCCYGNTLVANEKSLHCFALAN